MKTIYSSRFLNISFDSENELFIQDWVVSPHFVDDFKREMLSYVDCYRKYKPKYTLWLQENFSLELDKCTQLWLEENVNIPLLKNGNKKCAFVISKDLYAHLSIINSFDKYHSCITPKHFVSEEKARDWLNEERQIQTQSKKKKLYFDGIDEEGNLKIRLPSQDVKLTLKSLNKLLEKENFKRLNDEKFNLLTAREKEILTCISRRDNHKKIAESLFISIHTVRTHYKNIKLKLDFQNKTELFTFLTTYSF